MKSHQNSGYYYDNVLRNMLTLCLRMLYGMSLCLCDTGCFDSAKMATLLIGKLKAKVPVEFWKPAVMYLNGSSCRVASGVADLGWG